jgi:anti-sigma B factor antagonist
MSCTVGSSSNAGFQDGQVVNVTVETQDRAVLLAVSGDIDMVTAPEFEKAMLASLRDRPARLVVDLGEVSFLGSAGLTALVAAYREAGEHTSMRVVAENTVTARPLQLTGLDQQIPVFSSREQALAEG